MPAEKIALLGFGDIANRLSAHLSNDHVVGIKRSAISHPSVEIQTADCLDQASMDQLMQTGFDVLVITFTPTQMSEAGYRAGYVDTVQTLLRALKKQTHQPRLMVFVSSTSVYGQQGNEWVDETTPAEPSAYSGRCLLEAEASIAASGYHYCHVRFSGIYGPGRRRLIDQVIQGKGSADYPVVFSNRIHADDCAGVLAHLIERHKTQPIDSVYIATDCEPVPLNDVKQWMAQHLSLPSDHLTVKDVDRKRAPRSSKQCSNKKLLETGYSFLYPTFREGYSALIDSENMTE